MPDSIAVFPPGWRALDEEGAVVSGAQITFSAAGSETARTVYSDSGLSTSLGSLVYCDDGGYPVSASGSSTKVSVYTGATAYKVTCRTSSGVLVWQIDNVKGALDTSSFLTTSLETVDISVTAITSNTTLGASHKGKLINANPSGGAFTLTFGSALTLGDGWWVLIRHDGGSSSNAVNWATTSSQTVKVRGGTQTSGSIERGGDMVMIVCDGAGFTLTDVSSSISRDYRISATSASNALTIALLDKDGNTPSLTKQVEMRFAASDGSDTIVRASAATTLTVDSGATLGATSSTAFNVWVVIFNDSGTLRLGVINCRTSSGVYPLDSVGFVSSTAMGAGADSAGVFYSGSAVTTKPYLVLGRLEFRSGLATAGTWNVAPTQVVQHREGGRMPGDVIQTAIATTTAYASSATAMPFDDTIPQITEGVEVGTVSITPANPASVLRVEAHALLSSIGGASVVSMALFRDSTANALAAVGYSFASSNDSGNPIGQQSIVYEVTGNTASSTTFRMRAGSAGETVGINGTTAARYGGTGNTSIRVEEIMA